MTGQVSRYWLRFALGLVVAVPSNALALYLCDRLFDGLSIAGWESFLLGGFGVWLLGAAVAVLFSSPV